MVRKVLGVLVLTLVAHGAMTADTPTAKTLVGTWTLVAVERAGDNSTWTPQPLPRGALILDGAGHAFELAEMGRRVPYAGTQATPTEAHAVYNNYSGFWGSYKISPPAATITYRPEGAISPNAMAQDVVRTGRDGEDEKDGQGEHESAHRSSATRTDWSADGR